MNDSILPCPCKDCNNRNVTCHVDCKLYLDWRAKRDVLAVADKASMKDSIDAIESFYFKNRRRKRYTRRKL